MVAVQLTEIQVAMGVVVVFGIASHWILRKRINNTYTKEEIQEIVDENCKGCDSKDERAARE